MVENKLSISTPSELVRFTPDKIVYIEAQGNYSEFVQVDGKKNMLVIQLGKIAAAIEDQLDADENMFVRIGKSYIVNSNYIYQIKVQKKELVLSDMATFSITLSPSREALRNLKQLMDELIRSISHEQRTPIKETLSNLKQSVDELIRSISHEQQV